MKKGTALSFVILAFAMSLLLTVGCAKKPVPAETTAPAAEAPVTTERPAGEEVRGVEEQGIQEAPVTDQDAAAAGQAAGLERIFFEFNEFTLTSEARQILAANAGFLKSRQDLKVLIEGHCDDRGSDEYNLALGERRALAALDYLVSLGVAPARLSVISFGEERPLDPASNEAAWAKNRRAEFRVR